MTSERNKGGRPATGNTVKPVSLTLPLETIAALHAAAEAQGLPMSRIVAAAVDRFLADGGIVPPAAPGPAAEAARRSAKAVRFLRAAIAELEGDGQDAG